MAKETSQIAGIVLERGCARWTLLRRRKNRFERVGAEEAADLPEGGDAGAALADLRAAMGSLPSRVAVALPAERVLLRVLELPTGSEEELGPMVELQADKFCPFPTEQMEIAHEVLERGEDRSLVLVAAVQREALDAAAAPLLEAGLVIDRVDVDVLGLSRILSAEARQAGATGRHAALLLTADAADLVVFDGSRPLFFRSLPDGATDDPHFIQELAEELAYSLAALESEWGAKPLERMEVWSGDALSSEALAELQGRCGAPVELRPRDSHPPLSELLAWQAQEAGRLNLAPAEWSALRMSAAMRRKLAIGGAVVLGVWLLGMGLLYFGARQAQGGMGDLQARVIAQETRAAEISLLKARVGELERRSDRSESVLECLREVTVALPSGVDLSSFVYRKGEGVNLRGQAVQSTLVTEYVDALSRSGLFAEAKLETIGSRMVQNRRVSEYRINANLARVEAK